MLCLFENTEPFIRLIFLSPQVEKCICHSFFIKEIFSTSWIPIHQDDTKGLKNYSCLGQTTVICITRKISFPYASCSNYNVLFLRASLRVPKRVSNPGILVRLMKKLISNNSQTHLPIFWHMEKTPPMRIKLRAHIVAPIQR